MRTRAPLSIAEAEYIYKALARPGRPTIREAIYKLDRARDEQKEKSR